MKTVTAADLTPDALKKASPGATLLRLATELSPSDLCQQRVIDLPLRLLRATVSNPDGVAIVSDDNLAGAVRLGQEVTWFFCRVSDVPTSGKEVLDAIVPVGSGYSGTIVNDDLRAAVQKARPDITVSGQTLTAPKTA